MADDLSQLTQLTATTQTTNTITKAQREEVEALFNLVDTDGSGEIDEDELEELFALVGVDVSPEEISEVMREADAEFACARLGAGAPFAPRITRARRLEQYGHRSKFAAWPT